MYKKRIVKNVGGINVSFRRYRYTSEYRSTLVLMQLLSGLTLTLTVSIYITTGFLLKL